MKKQSFIIRHFGHNEPPKNILECLIAGIIGFALIIIAAQSIYYATSFFTGEPIGSFPWTLMFILLPAAFMKPFFDWHENKSK